VYTWGMGSDGQGGHGHFLHMRTPKRVEVSDRYAYVRHGLNGH